VRVDGDLRGGGIEPAEHNRHWMKARTSGGLID
jgi:hypothetical protein